MPYVEFFWEDEEWDCNLCLVMAHCEGGDLCADIGRRRKEKRPFTEEEVIIQLYRHCDVHPLASASVHQSRPIEHRAEDTVESGRSANSYHDQHCNTPHSSSRLTALRLTAGYHSV